VSSDDTTIDEGKSRFAALVGRCGDVAIGGLVNLAGHLYTTRVLQAATANAIGKIRKLSAGRAYLRSFFTSVSRNPGLRASP